MWIKIGPFTTTTLSCTRAARWRQWSLVIIGFSAVASGPSLPPFPTLFLLLSLLLSQSVHALLFLTTPVLCQITDWHHSVTEYRPASLLTFGKLITSGWHQRGVSLCLTLIAFYLVREIFRKMKTILYVGDHRGVKLRSSDRESRSVAHPLNCFILI